MSSSEGEILSEEEEEQEEQNEDGNLEEGELVAKQRVATVAKEVENDSLEEGEVEEEEQASVSVCRFFGKGLCTWGQSCRFLHPGVNDKGLYTMFEPLPRPPPQQHLKPGLLGHAPPNFPVVKAPIIVSGPESAWERGVRHAKEIIKQSVKRKESDVDFEEKKMNMSLAQEEIDKENDFYYVKKQLDEETPKNAEPLEENDEEKILLLQQKRANKIDPDFVRREVHHVRRPVTKWQKKSRSRSSSRSSSGSSSSPPRKFSRSRSNSGSSGGGKRVIMRKAPPRELSPDFVAGRAVRIAPPPPEDFQQQPPRRAPYQQRYNNNNRFPRRPHPPFNSFSQQPSSSPLPQQHPPQQQQQQQQQAQRYYRSKFQRRSSSSSSSSSSRSRSRSRTRSPRKITRRRSSSSTTDSYNKGKRRHSSSSDSSSSLDTTHIEPRGRKSKSPPVSSVLPLVTKEIVPKKIKLTIETKNRPLNKNNVVIEKLDDFEEELSSSSSTTTTTTNQITTATSKTRREELMKQLRAVEEAIAKKRSKIEK